MNPLVIFYRDETMRNTVKEFMVAQLEQMAIDRTFNKEDVVGIAEAKELVDKTFSKLKELYEPEAKVKVETVR